MVTSCSKPDLSAVGGKNAECEKTCRIRLDLKGYLLSCIYTEDTDVLLLVIRPTATLTMPQNGRGNLFLASWRPFPESYMRAPSRVSPFHHRL